jgi:hypothetical protein
MDPRDNSIRFTSRQAAIIAAVSMACSIIAFLVAILAVTLSLVK